MTTHRKDARLISLVNVREETGENLLFALDEDGNLWTAQLWTEHQVWEPAQIDRAGSNSGLRLTGSRADLRRLLLEIRKLLDRDEEMQALAARIETDVDGLGGGDAADADGAS